MNTRKPRVSTLRDIDNLSGDVLSYLCDTKRPIIIKMFEDIRRDFNSYTNTIKSITNNYYSIRLNQMTNVIEALKKNKRELK